MIGWMSSTRALRTRLARSVGLLCSVWLLGAAALAQSPPAAADLTPILEHDGARLGSSVRAALQVSLPAEPAGLHTNSNKPRDPNLIPIELRIDPPAGISVAEIVFPEPIDLAQAGVDQPLSVFERDFPIGVVFEIAKDVTLGEVTIPATLRYQACDDRQCYFPVRLKTGWTVRVVEDNASIKAVNSKAIASIAFGRGEKPPERPKEITSEPTDGQAVAAAAAPGTKGIDRLDGFTLAGTTGYSSTSEFVQFIRDAESGVQRRGMFDGRGPLAILLLVFLGGLALNLTPCVLPMIPINLAIIGAGSQAGSRGRGFLLGGVYGAAMALVYGVLGVIVVTTASTFGTINASPWFNVTIAIIFALLALAMFDVITIDFSKFAGAAGTTGSRGSVALAFGMGAIAALLAGACVAPVVIQVVLFSSDLYSKGTVLALGLPFLLGVGMAVPWPLAGAGITALPKPGAWMVRVKQVFGVIILATAAYYGYLAYGLFADRWVDARDVQSSVDEQLKAGWYASLADGLAAARREHKPVLIDMWATWCKNCLVMDETTLADPDVKKALEGYVKIKFQAEQPDEDPARGVMNHFKGVGLPTYAIIRPPSSTSPDRQ